ncbi:hypothetical protein QWI17_19070 [Gilvimarinus sp. SDUM040013]|uniref:Uncharacterized protein n=1 Tax=Gilvimarinus gilvus TaxID=3058038 RepID=A0ABU4RUX9_9GAMM|nr:hypothetical protein [Gilvimarinus sp. SDUM040013]MDO3387954.1 hypothetical protein [Gilvimarinus sp. SDUM040013]MDX6848675.1 hypothetical protein [Gilvimarinus sp. SDUM040013]
MATNTHIVRKLLEKGRRISVGNGGVTLTPLPTEEKQKIWLRENSDLIVSELGRLLGRQPLKYLDFSTGIFYGGRAPGVNFQLLDLLSFESRHVIFNVNLKRKNTSKNAPAGALYDGNKFWVGRLSQFYRFWQSAGLPEPKRDSLYHKSMFRLKSLYFEGEVLKREKLDNKSFRVLNIEPEEVEEAVLGSTVREFTGNNTDTIQKLSQKLPIPQSQVRQGMQSVTTEGENNRGKRLQGSEVQGESDAQAETKRIQEQSVDEWLADYNSVTPLTKK